MKKQYVSLLAVILSVSGFLFSCHDKMNKNTGALQFDPGIFTVMTWFPGTKKAVPWSKKDNKKSYDHERTGNHRRPRP